MAVSAVVTQFVRDALLAGRSRAEIGEALSQAGWTKRDVDLALNSYADGAFLPPVPRPTNRPDARDAFLYLLLFTALGIVAVSLVNLLHGLIDIYVPGERSNYGSGSARWVDSKIRWAIAALIVGVPIFLLVTRHTDRLVQREPEARQSIIRRWLTYLTLFIASVVLMVDGIWVVFSFLDGEATLPFLLKASVVGCVAAAIFARYTRAVTRESYD